MTGQRRMWCSPDDFNKDGKKIFSCHEFDDYYFNLLGKGNGIFRDRATMRWRLSLILVKGVFNKAWSWPRIYNEDSVMCQYCSALEMLLFRQKRIICGSEPIVLAAGDFNGDGAWTLLRNIYWWLRSVWGNGEGHSWPRRYGS
jgi:hypothetical protein